MENIEKRLIQLIKTLGYNNARFADAIDVQRSSISHILSGRNKPSFEFLRKLFLQFPEINADWLIMGRGNMFEKESPAPEVDNKQSVLSDSETLFTNDTGKVTDVTGKVSKTPEKSSEGIEKIIVLHTNGTFSEFVKR